MSTTHNSLCFVPINSKGNNLNEGNLGEDGCEQISFDVFNEKFVGRLYINRSISRESTTTWKFQICKQNDNRQVREFYSLIPNKGIGKDLEVEKVKEFAQNCYRNKEEKEWKKLPTPLKQIVSDELYMSTLKEKLSKNSTRSLFSLDQLKQLLFQKLENLKSTVETLFINQVSGSIKNSEKSSRTPFISTMKNLEFEINELEAVCLDDVLFVAVSNDEIESIIDSSLNPADPVQFDMFNTRRDTFCGQLDIYFKNGGNWCYTDWRVSNGEFEYCFISLPFEAVFVDIMPENLRDVILGIMKRVKYLHDTNADDVNCWKQVGSELPQRISPERFEVLRESYAIY